MRVRVRANFFSSLGERLNENGRLNVRSEENYTVRIFVCLKLFFFGEAGGRRWGEAQASTNAHTHTNPVTRYLFYIVLF